MLILTAGLIAVAANAETSWKTYINRCWLAPTYPWREKPFQENAATESRGGGNTAELTR